MKALFRKLSYYADMGDAGESVISAIPSRREKIDSGEDIITRGDDPDEGFVISAGWAARYISLEDGRSQILNFMLPGDMFDLQVFVTDGADHSVMAITDVEVFWISRASVLSVFERDPRAGAAFWWCALQEEAILREQIVRNGRRSARERVAHLLLELRRRATVAGEGDGATFHMPVSQALLADALGLSFVHINRVLREFQKTGCIERTRTELTLLDSARLIEISGFDDDYLHLDVHPRRLSFAEARSDVA